MKYKQKLSLRYASHLYMHTTNDKWFPCITIYSIENNILVKYDIEIFKDFSYVIGAYEDFINVMEDTDKIICEII